MRHGRLGLLALLLLAAVPAWAQSLGSPGGGGFNVSRTHSQYVGESGGSCRLPGGPVIGVDATECNNYAVVLGGNWRFANPTNLLPGQSQAFEIGQPSTGGPFLPSFGTLYSFPSGTPLSCTTAGQSNCFSRGNGVVDYLPCVGSILQPGRVICGPVIQNALIGAAPIWTWNPAQKNVNITLDTTNTVASSTTGTDLPVFSGNPISTGQKVFFAVDETTDTITGVGVGIGTAGSPTTGFLGSAATEAGYFGTDGAVWINNIKVANFATWPSGITVCVAVDYNAAKIWFGLLGSGLWDNDVLANQNPSTGVGGISISGVTSSGSVPVVPAASISGNTTIIADASPCSGMAGLTGFLGL